MLHVDIMFSSTTCMFGKKLVHCPIGNPFFLFPFSFDSLVILLLSCNYHTISPARARLVPTLIVILFVNLKMGAAETGLRCCAFPAMC